MFLCKNIYFFDSLIKTNVKNLNVQIKLLPDKIINLSIEELEKVLFEIIQQNFQKNPEDIEDLKNAYAKIRKAHDDTKIVRKGSGLPYIHHPLSVAIFVWYFAKVTNYRGSYKELLLSALYHDTIEDTNIFGTNNTGKQFSKIGDYHGENVMKAVYYLTKIPLKIDRQYEKMRNNIKRDHLIMFEFEHVPLVSRYIKISDRIMNLADLQYVSKNHRLEQFYYTGKHFSSVLKYLPTLGKIIFMEHYEEVIKKYDYQRGKDNTLPTLRDLKKKSKRIFRRKK